MRLKFRDDSGDHEIVVRQREDGCEVVTSAGPEPVTVIRAGDGAWLVPTPSGGRRRAWVVAYRDERYVFCDGIVHRLHRPGPEDRDGDAPEADGPNLHARMPGRIVRLPVAAGDVVAAGQTLVIMESMKMETELAAPASGTVTGVKVSEGQVVGQGELLVTVALLPTPNPTPAEQAS